MIKLYVCDGSYSSRKTKAWLINNGISFREKNTQKQMLTLKELRAILCLSQNGTSDIISKRSNAYKEIGINIDNLKVNELIEYIQKNPTILRHPIIMSDRVLVVGFDVEQLRQLQTEEENTMNTQEVASMSTITDFYMERITKCTDCDKLRNIHEQIAWSLELRAADKHMLTISAAKKMEELNETKSNTKNRE